MSMYLVLSPIAAKMKQLMPGIVVHMVQQLSSNCRIGSVRVRPCKPIGVVWQCAMWFQENKVQHFCLGVFHLPMMLRIMVAMSEYSGETSVTTFRIKNGSSAQGDIAEANAQPPFCVEFIRMEPVFQVCQGKATPLRRVNLPQI